MGCLTGQLSNLEHFPLYLETVNIHPALKPPKSLLLIIQVGITPEEHEKVAKILSDNKIASRELLKKSIDANSYDYISATYLLLAEQVRIVYVTNILVNVMC